MPRPRVGTLALVAALAAIGAGSAACGGSNVPAAAPSAAAVVSTVAESGPGGLTGFADCSALERRLRDLTLPHVTFYGLDNGPVDGPRNYLRPRPRIGDSTTTWPPDHWDPSGPRLSTSESEVPAEAKTDGRLLVALHGRTLQVVDVSTDKPALLSTLALKGQYGEGLLLAGDRALVIGTLDDAEDSVLGGPMFGPGEPRGGAQHSAVLTLVDLSDPLLPSVLGSEEILGDRAGAWFSDGVARIAVSSHPFLARHEDPPFTKDAAVVRNRRLVQESPATAWLPHRRILDESGETVAEGPLLGCTEVLGSANDSGVDLLSVVTLDLARPDPFAAGTSTAIIGSGALVHASPGRLFVTTTAGGWGNVIPMHAAGPANPTTVHAFDVSGRGQPRYLAGHGLSGYVPSADDLSVHEGRLRVATTTGRPWWSGSFDPPGRLRISILGTYRLERLGSVGLGALALENEAPHWDVRWLGAFAAVRTSLAGPVQLIDLAGKGDVRDPFPDPGLGMKLYPVGAERAVRLEQVRSRPGKKHAADQIRVTTFDLGSPKAPRWVEALDVERGQALGDLVYLPRPGVALLLGAYRDVGLSCPANSFCVTDTRRVPERCRPITVCPKLRGPARVGGVIGLRLDKAGIATRVGMWNAQGPRAVLQVRGLLALLTTRGMALIDPRTMREVGSLTFNLVKTIPG
jgi:hypothetical protein